MKPLLDGRCSHQIKDEAKLEAANPTTPLEQISLSRIEHDDVKQLLKIPTGRVAGNKAIHAVLVDREESL